MNQNQAAQKGSGNRKWVWGLLVVALTVGGVFGVRYYRTQRQLAIAYREVQVVRDQLNVTVVTTGTVQPENRLEIKPPVAGRVEQVLVKEGQAVKRGQVLAWMSSTERAALVDAARSRGASEARRWEEDYKPTPIMAPISGTVILRNVESGQTFASTDSVFVMSDRLTVKAQVDETDIAQIKVGQRASIVLDAYAKESVRAQVDQIAFDAKTVNNVTTYVVDVLPDETPPFMRSGMTANVTVSIDSKQNILIIPNDAIRVQDRKYVVLVRAPTEGATQEREVELGISDGKRTEVLKGLQEGETILVAEIKSSAEKRSQNGSPLTPMRSRRGGH